MASETAKRNKKKQQREKRRVGKRSIYDGIIPLCAILSIVAICYAIFSSWSQSGAGDGAVGAMGEISLVLAIGAVVLGILVRRDLGPRHRAINISMVVGGVVALICIVIFAFGLF